MWTIHLKTLNASSHESPEGSSMVGLRANGLTNFRRSARLYRMGGGGTEINLAPPTPVSPPADPHVTLV